MPRAATLLFLLALLSPGALAPAAAQDVRRLTQEHDGIARTAILDADPGLRDAPLLIVLHGGIGGAEFIRRRAGVTLAAQGWAVVWPSAVDDWADGRRDPAGRPHDEADDVGFLRALVARLAAEGLVDPARVHVAGPSIGGMMALRLVCDAPDLIAAAAIAIAALPEGLDCPPGPPVPVLFLHADADPIVPPGGGRIGGDSPFVRDRGRVISAEATVARLAARNGCAGFAEVALPDRDPGDGSTTLRRDYQGCAAPLRHFIVRGAGHTWPGGRPSRLGDALVGGTSRDFSATAEIEAFLRAVSGGTAGN